MFISLLLGPFVWVLLLSIFGMVQCILQGFISLPFGQFVLVLPSVPFKNDTEYATRWPSFEFFPSLIKE